MIPGFKSIVFGPTGTGKTYAFTTIPEELESFIIFTEPSMEVLSHVGCDHLHWAYIPPHPVGIKAMINMAKQVNIFDRKTLLDSKDPKRGQYNSYIKFLETLASPTCDRCGKTFKAADEWDQTKFLGIDSTSGLAVMTMSLIVGGRPVKSMDDWGQAVDMLEQLFMLICSLKCHVSITAHPDRVISQDTGVTLAMPQTLGNKLSPRVPRFFSDVIYTSRVADKWYWSTTEVSADTKARNLPWKSQITPSYTNLYSAWKKHAEPDQTTRGNVNVNIQS